MRYFIVLCALVGFILGPAQNSALAEEVVVGPTLEKSEFKPKIDYSMAFPSREHMQTTRKYLLEEQIGLVSGPQYWNSPREHELCPNPFVIMTDMIVEPDVLMDYDCFIVLNGDLRRMTKSGWMWQDKELIEFNGKKYRFPANSSYILLNGRFIDNLPKRLKARAPDECGSCETDEETKLTTCDLMDREKAICHDVEYRDVNMMVVNKLLQDTPISACHHHVEGQGTVSGDVCQVVALSDGKMNIDCSTRFMVDATNGAHDIFLSDSDGWLMANMGDKIYVGKGVNLLFIDRTSETSAVVVKPKDAMPCLRIIAVEEGF